MFLSRKLALHMVLLALSLTAISPAQAASFDAQQLHNLSIIESIADHYGVDYYDMRRVALCESSAYAWATGDRGRSHGLYQLNDLPGTGLLWHFYSVGYTNPYNAWQAADYYARVKRGDFAHEMVGTWRWSCR